MVAEEDNTALCQLPTMDVVKVSIFSISKYSVQGLGGFGSKFYMSCWEVIKENFLVAIHDFFEELLSLDTTHPLT